jgi:transcriptional regulator with XRE-family HTH domain
MYSAGMTIGKRLEEAMTRAKYASQAALALVSGVPQGTISRILNDKGVGLPDTDTLQKLATACQVPFEWLLDGPKTGDKPLPPLPDRVDLDKSLSQAIELMQILRSLPPKGRNALIEAAYDVVVSFAAKGRIVGRDKP